LKGQRKGKTATEKESTERTNQERNMDDKYIETESKKDKEGERRERKG
jgi:hypothetical protein